MEYTITDVVAEAFICDPKYFPNQICFLFNWSADIGFGQFSYRYNKDTEKWTFDTEQMPAEFCADVFKFWIKEQMKEDK